MRIGSSNDNSLPHAKNLHDSLPIRNLLLFPFLLLAVLDRTEISLLIDTLRPLLHRWAGAQLLLHHPHTFFHECIAIEISARCRRRNQGNLRVPIIVESNGNNVAILLVLQNLQGNRSFSVGVEVIAQELHQYQLKINTNLQKISPSAT